MSINFEELIEEFKSNLKLDYNLKKKNWFNIGGTTKAFYKADSLKELIRFLKKIQNHEKIFVLGAGSIFFSNRVGSDTLFFPEASFKDGLELAELSFRSSGAL